MSTPEEDAFRKRIEQSLATVRAWETDEDQLKRCRQQIPWAELRRDLPSASNHVDPDHVFLQRLAKHFQTNVMTWINQPPCSTCNSTDHMKSQSTRAATTDAERRGRASRVEVYTCSSCPGQPETTFPRYNATQTLIETCAGRCGEYANLFGLYCRAAGYATRYVVDWTDHVWTEVWCASQWIMVDSCEGVTAECSMYEAGWGKDLSYIVAVSTTQVVDVTPKYTRKFRTGDFQARRRAITTSEAAGENVIRKINQGLHADLSEKEAGNAKLMLEREVAHLNTEKSQTDWSHEYVNGRTSGSLEWRACRQEIGNSDGESSDEGKGKASLQYSYRLAAYYPFREKLEIQLEVKQGPSLIVVNGSSCAIGIPNTLSVVVLDEKRLGCILQSSCYASSSELTQFISTLPKGRIVLLAGQLPEHETTSATLSTLLPGCRRMETNRPFAFVGQKLYRPRWATFITSADDATRTLVLESVAASKKAACGIRTCRNSMARTVTGRLPERCMPLQTQKLAKYEQKRTAFENFLKSGDGDACCGYATRPGAPVYLLGASGYPLSKDVYNESNSDSWTAFLVLPQELVPSSDTGIQDMMQAKRVPLYEVPLESDFFIRSLGPSLLSKSSLAVETTEALRNVRLVGLYFSAHWCGPCRSFTPMLSELYSVLKESLPTHGLEIVFVSSDRDQNEFQNYYNSMPWLSLPFGSYQKQILSSVYGVKGIPSLVILDALSGQVVVPVAETRQEIQRACNMGDSGIHSMMDSWLDRVPPESKELLQLLESSCEQDASPSMEEAIIPEDYLVGAEFKQRRVETQSLIQQLIEDGMDEEDAREAATAIQKISEDELQEEAKDTEPGPLDMLFLEAPLVKKEASSPTSFDITLCKSIAQKEGREKLRALLSTTLKYVSNCAKSPWTTKFRRIQLSFRMADKTITSIPQGVSLLEALGCSVVSNADDYVAQIPVHMDLEVTMATIQSLLQGEAVSQEDVAAQAPCVA